MEIRQGIATDYGKEKFDCTVDEVDLKRIAHEYGIPKDTEFLTTLEAMLLLALESERFVLVQAPKYGRDVTQVRQQIDANREQFADVLAKVKGTTIEDERKAVGL